MLDKISIVTNGSVIPLVTNYNGLKFYSPNDVAVKSDGTIWFTDPGYNSGITKPHSGYPPDYYVYRFHPTNANATCQAVMTNGFGRADGLGRQTDSVSRPMKPGFMWRTPMPATMDIASMCIPSPPATRLRTAPSLLTSPMVFRMAFIATWMVGLVEWRRRALYICGRRWPSDREDKVSSGRESLLWGGPQYKTLYMVGQPIVTSIPVLVAGNSAP